MDASERPLTSSIRNTWCRTRSALLVQQAGLIKFIHILPLSSWALLDRASSKED